jgi:hypothetical protein
MSNAGAILGRVGALGLTAACAAVPPSGPTVLVLPPEGKDLGRFQQESANCQNYAAAQIGPATGADTAYTLQRRYDVAYVQCMAASGNRLQPPLVGYGYSSLYGYGYPGYYYPGYYGGTAYLGFGGYYGRYGYRPYFGPYRYGRGYGPPPPPPPPPPAFRRPPPPPPPR